MDHRRNGVQRESLIADYALKPGQGDAIGCRGGGLDADAASQMSTRWER